MWMRIMDGFHAEIDLRVIGAAIKTEVEVAKAEEYVEDKEMRPKHCALRNRRGGGGVVAAVQVKGELVESP